MTAPSSAWSPSDSPIRVTITPSRSAYFAGEDVSVFLTFTNTRTSVATASRLSPSFAPSHKRASHSVSAAPLSRPPTSPGTPKHSHTGASLLPTNVAEDIHKKGVIGVKLRRKSLSVEINPLG